MGKSYPLPTGQLRVFSGLNFELRRGELVAIMGVSGVGKTTLLNMFGVLDSPTEGRVFLEGEDIFAKDEKEKAAARNRRVGFIFQFYHLLPEFSSVENVIFPLLIRRADRKDALSLGLRMLREVGLAEKAFLRPSQLSGGEQQRIAIARALINDPIVLLADEPTGNLDWKTGQRVLALIHELHQKKGLSSIIVTHNEKIARYCHKTYLMESGQLKLLSPLPSST